MYSTGLTRLFAESRDYDELALAWKRWRDVSKGEMKELYAEFVELSNEAMRGEFIYIIIFITKTYLYNFDLIKPHFFIVKLGFTEVYIFFFIFAQKA